MTTEDVALWIKQNYCRHKTMSIFRCHANVGPSLTDKDKVAWVDEHDVNNFIRCADCHKIMPYKKSMGLGLLYGEKL